MYKRQEEALERRGLKGHLECIDEVTQYRVVYEPQNNPVVSIAVSYTHLDVYKRQAYNQPVYIAEFCDRLYNDGKQGFKR